MKKWILLPYRLDQVLNKQISINQLEIKLYLVELYPVIASFLFYLCLLLAFLNSGGSSIVPVTQAN